MHTTIEEVSTTAHKLIITADQAELDRVKEHVLKELGGRVKIQGFRSGKAPQHLIEKQLDPATLQNEFLEHAINDLYVPAVQQHKLRPVSQPKISVVKFVPFTALEFTAEIEVVGDIKLANYKTIKLSPKKVEVTAADVTEVLENLRTRAAEKKEVERAAKLDDEVTIDFLGTDAKTGEAISGADGTDYPLVLGSNSFIPGFEDALIGLKPGAEKDFELTFPADYGAKELQNRKVKFGVTVTKVSEPTKPKLDDAFAATVGPFKTLAELKTDIKKQLKDEREREAKSNFENELLDTIATKSTLDLPEALVQEEMARLEEDEKRNIVYRGQTWQEHLDEEGLTAEEHTAKQRPAAEKNLRAGLVLGEIADKEGITVTPEELEIRIMLLKNQYPEEQMQAELEKPENRRDIQNRLMTEKTLDKLTKYATAKN
jgi:trigger factor